MGTTKIVKEIRTVNYLKVEFMNTSLAQKNSQIRSERMRIARSKGTHTKQEWEDMKTLFNNVCIRCDGQSGLANVEKDHIIPVYQGGSDSIKNLQPICAKCNCQKGSEDIDWRRIYCSDNNIPFPEAWEGNQ